MWYMCVTWAVSDVCVYDMCCVGDMCVMWCVCDMWYVVCDMHVLCDVLYVYGRGRDREYKPEADTCYLSQ